MDFTFISTIFRFLAASAIVLTTLCAIKCGTALLAALSEPFSTAFADVASMAFVAYRARSDPIVLTIPDPHTDTSSLQIVYSCTSILPGER